MQGQWVYADLDLAKEGLQDYADWLGEPVCIIPVRYGREQLGIEYHCVAERICAGNKDIIITCYPRKQR